jgi:imidazoleglycerol phosphate dehydratase HisB
MYTNVSANIAKELVAAGDANAIHLIEYRGIKRYVKLTLDMQGALASAAVSVTGLSTFVEVM